MLSGYRCLMDVLDFATRSRSDAGKDNVLASQPGCTIILFCGHSSRCSRSWFLRLPLPLLPDVEARYTKTAVYVLLLVILPIWRLASGTADVSLLASIRHDVYRRPLLASFCSSYYFVYRDFPILSARNIALSPGGLLGMCCL